MPAMHVTIRAGLSPSASRSNNGHRDVFMKSSTQHNAEIAVLNKVSLLLDHLFQQHNTALFIAEKFIQRFTSSNPSGLYLQTVAKAFMNSVFNETVYGGKYGDLAATFAAIVLHPREA